ALHRQVFPELARLCEKAGCRFLAIDLRWGISEEMGLDQKTVEICLQEIARCQATNPQPNFIILLGDRYGWRPLPAQIEAGEFEAIWRIADEKKIPATPLLRRWYRLDENAVPPAYTLRRRMPEADADYTEPSIWSTRVEIPLRELFASCLPTLALPEARRAIYEHSLTEREITAGALRPEVAGVEDHAFAYFRTFEALERFETTDTVDPADQGQRANQGQWADQDQSEDLAPWTDVTPSGRLDKEARAQLEALKGKVRARLGTSHCRTYRPRQAQEHLEEFCRDVLNDLRNVIEAEIAKFAAADALESEIEAHREFADSRGGKERFRGREQLLDRIAAYLRSTEPGRPLVVCGPAGIGKSALLARAASQAGEQLPAGTVIQRFVGATPSSTEGISLLQSICTELGVALGDPAAVPSDYQELISVLRNHLGQATEQRPIAVFIDAIDQLSPADEARALAWLPRGLPAHARLIVSVLGVPAQAKDPKDPLRLLVERAEPADIVSTDELPLEEAAILLTDWLAADQRALTQGQHSAVLEAFKQCPRPLFLALATEEAKLWRSEDAPVLPEAQDPDAMLAAIIEQLFDRLAEPTHHGRLLVERGLGFLAAAKTGLSEGEMIDLLSTDRQFFDAFSAGNGTSGHSLPEGVEVLPAAVWARFYSDLQPYLTIRQADGVSLLAFYHRSLEAAAKARFLADPHEATQRRQHIADYFAEQDLFLMTAEELQSWAKELPPKPRPVNQRKVTELPHQLVEIARVLGGDDADSPHWRAVSDLLLDLPFLEALAERNP
ncbi:MAG: AAA family ATPase, partial [Acidobacteriota bacterium]